MKLLNHFSSGFGNPFGYLMGNGGLCGGRADNKASSTSGASPFSDQNQRYVRKELFCFLSLIVWYLGIQIIIS